MTDRPAELSGKVVRRAVCGVSCPDLETVGAACASVHRCRGSGCWGRGRSTDRPPLVYRLLFTVYKPLSINSFLFTVALWSEWGIITAHIVKIIMLKVVIYWIVS